MSPITRAAGVLCTIIGLAVFSIESPAAGSSTEIAALEAADQNWVRAYNAGNADAVASLYDEQAVLLPPGGPGVSGRAAIKAFFVKDTAGKVVETGKYLSVSMKKGGKWLYVRDTWNADGAPPRTESIAPSRK